MNSKKRFLTIGIVLILLFLISCDKIEDQDIFLNNFNVKADKELTITEKPEDPIDKNYQQVDQAKEIKAVMDRKGEVIRMEGKDSMEEALGDFVTNSKDEIMLSDLSKRLENIIEVRDYLLLYKAGTIVDTTGMEKLVIESLFYEDNISEEVKNRMIGKSYGENCDIPLSELRYLRLLHLGFDSKTHIGELIVSKEIAEDVIDIFKELYEAEYKIEKMLLIDDFQADDIASMEANNTSAFNYRVIDGTNKLSLHSYGIAIDINPLYNPYVRIIDGKQVVLPSNSVEYVDRSTNCEYYIKKEDLCYRAFIKRGFTWGGDWKNKDYQHFQKDQRK